MANLSGDAYGLTTLCPLINRAPGETSSARLARELVDALPTGEHSPMAQVPGTYLARMFVLDDVVFQGLDVAPWIPLPIGAHHDRLKSAYLVFACDFHGPDLAPYLWTMWDVAEETIRSLWQHCVGFGEVHDAASWERYLRRCQVQTTFYFDGSTDEPLTEQLKGLYLKQELAKFAFEYQDATPEELQDAFFDFVARVRPDDLDGPTWRPGAATLDRAPIDHRRPAPLPSNVTSIEDAAPSPAAAVAE